MRRNIMGYFGLLGFLGLLGLITGRPVYYCWFSFFSFFCAFLGKGSDERIERNINRACRNAFAFVTATWALSFAYIAIFGEAVGVFPLASTLIFVFGAGSMVVFSLSCFVYGRRGD